MLASSNIEEASQMSNLQGNAHDPWDEDERQKIYLITTAWRKKSQARRDCNPSERRSKTYCLKMSSM